MRTIKELAQQNPVFLGSFSNRENVLDKFGGVGYGWTAEMKEEAYKNLSDINILFAHYEGCSYDGYAFVLFEKDGKLYEVNGSSCYGLEGQWYPEETFLESLKFRIEEGRLGNPGGCSDTDFKEELVNFLGL